MILVKLCFRQNSEILQYTTNIYEQRGVLYSFCQYVVKFNKLSSFTKGSSSLCFYLVNKCHQALANHWVQLSVWLNHSIPLSKNCHSKLRYVNKCAYIYTCTPICSYICTMYVCICMCLRVREIVELYP